jgi:hypothetical protein
MKAISHMQSSRMLGLVFAFAGCTLNADDPPARSAQLAVLDQFVGEWEMNAKLTTQEHPDGQQEKLVSSSRWILAGRFLESRGKKDEIISLTTYDADQKCFRRWSFSAKGYASEGTGQWDDAKRRFTWDLKFPESVTATATEQFLPDGTIAFMISFKDPAGKFYRGGVGKITKLP